MNTSKSPTQLADAGVTVADTVTGHLAAAFAVLVQPLPPAILAPFSSPLFNLALTTLAALLLYRFYFTAPFRKPAKHLSAFDKKSERFERLRKSAYPPPYPNGWWKLCDVADLTPGKIVSVSAIGKEIVIFRNAKTGDIGVMDAFCPHLGAHLGDGKIVGDGTKLQCPFHAWEFETSGQCTSIPYCTASPLPASARQTTYTNCTYMNGVYIWFHADGAAPTYQLGGNGNARIKEYEQLVCSGTMTCYGTMQTRFNMHINEMAENSADYYHFESIHGPMPLPYVNKLIKVRYDTELFFGEPDTEKHICYFDNWAEMWLLNKFRMAVTRQLTRVTFEGPSVIHFHIETPLGTLHLVKTLLPVEPFVLQCDDTWYAEPRAPRWLVHAIMKTAKGGLEQDRFVWESKRYAAKPLLVKGDGPFPLHRRWWRQFYSENSKKYAYASEQVNMEW